MVKILSWIIVICLVLLALGGIIIAEFSLTFLTDFYRPIFYIILFSSILLIIKLIIDRVKEKEVEKNDLDKY